MQATILGLAIRLTLASDNNLSSQRSLQSIFEIDPEACSEQGHMVALIRNKASARFGHANKTKPMVPANVPRRVEPLSRSMKFVFDIDQEDCQDYLVVFLQSQASAVAGRGRSAKTEDSAHHQRKVKSWALSDLHSVSPGLVRVALGNVASTRREPGEKNLQASTNSSERVGQTGFAMIATPDSSQRDSARLSDPRRHTAAVPNIVTKVIEVGEAHRPAQLAQLPFADVAQATLIAGCIVVLPSVLILVAFSYASSGTVSEKNAAFAKALQAHGASAIRSKARSPVEVEEPDAEPAPTDDVLPAGSSM